MKRIIKSTRRTIRNNIGDRKLVANRIQTAHNSSDKSILFFTTHKCASSFINTLFDVVTSNSVYSSIDYMSTIRGLGDQTEIHDSYEFVNENYSYCFRQFNEIYVPLRKPLNFPGMENFRKIFFLRDPRDVLVSGFFSFGESHPTPHNSEKQKVFLERRANIQKMGIDAFVLSEVETWIKPIYAEYKNIYEATSDRLFLKYDLFKDQTNVFITNLIKFIGIDVKEKVINDLVEKASPVQKKVKSGTHKRSGQSKQFESELKQETVVQLNELLSEELEFWDF